MLLGPAAVDAVARQGVWSGASGELVFWWGPFGFTVLCGCASRIVGVLVVGCSTMEMVQCKGYFKLQPVGVLCASDLVECTCCLRLLQGLFGLSRAQWHLLLLLMLQLLLWSML